jgi:acyl dehydratase
MSPASGSDHRSEPVPWKLRYFEDYRVGESVEFGDYLVTQEEIIAFAKAYDPQSFHVDPVAARDSHFGGLVASGWMTCSIVSRLTCDHLLPPVSAMGSPGMERVTWLAPVRPQDRIRIRVSVLEVRRSQKKPDRGVVRLRQEAINQDGKTVLTMEGISMHRCRG